MVSDAGLVIYCGEGLVSGERYGIASETVGTDGESSGDSMLRKSSAAGTSDILGVGWALGACSTTNFALVSGATVLVAIFSAISRCF